jgi:hypothetical protein
MRPTRFSTYATVFGLYLLVAVLVTYPLIANLSTVITGFDYGDGYEMAHHIWWFKHALQTGQNVFFQPLLAYPNGIDAITLWANPLQFFPAWLLAFALPLPAAANLTLLLTMALNGLAMFHLASYLFHQQEVKSDKLKVESETAGQSRLFTFNLQLFPTFLAGLAFMLYPTMQGHLAAGHAGLIVQWGVPLYAWALLRLREHGGWRRIALAALCLLLSVWGHTLQLIYVVLPLTGVFVLALLLRREWRALARVVAAGVIGGVLLVLFLLPVFRSTLGTAAYTDEGGGVRYSADLLAIVTPSFRHPLYGRLDYTRQVLGVNLDEGSAYIGIVAGALALIALLRARQARWWGVLALVTWVLSMGSLLKIFDQPVRFTVDGYESYITLPWAALQNLPLFSLARTPGRFNFTLALAVAALVGYGAYILLNPTHSLKAAQAKGAGELTPNRIIAVVLAALLIFDYQWFWPLPTVPAAISDAVTALSAEPDDAAVFDIPWENLVTAKYGLYLLTAHNQPLISGHITRRTPASPARLSILEAALDPALLGETGVSIVTVHKPQDAEGILLGRARTMLGEPRYEDERLAVFNVPSTEGSADFTVLPFPLSVEAQADAYLFAPDEGWALFSARLEADERETVLRLDGLEIHRWWLDSAQEVFLPLPVNAGAFHTLTLALEPPCPRNDNPALSCRTVEVSEVRFEFQGAARQAAQFGRGVALQGAFAPETGNASETLPVWLSWSFSEAVTDNDIRFVHLLDANGELQAQVDVSLGARAAGTGWAEQVDLPLRADLPPGTYSLYTGWYTYPDLLRFPVLTDSPRMADGLFLIGEVRVE